MKFVKTQEESETIGKQTANDNGAPVWIHRTFLGYYIYETPDRINDYSWIIEPD